MKHKKYIIGAIIVSIMGIGILFFTNRSDFLNAPAQVIRSITQSGRITDVCPNLPDIQLAVPTGYHLTPGALPSCVADTQCVERFLVAGGVDYNNPNSPNVGLNDIWNFNGTTWTQVDTDTATPGIQNAPWAGRSYFGSLITGRKLWVMQGVTTTLPRTYQNDIWSTSDLQQWTRVDTDTAIPGIQNAPWTARHKSGVVYFNGKTYVIGGIDDNNNTWPYYGWPNDIWSSVDGVTWTPVDTNPNLGGIQGTPWPQRTLEEYAVFNGKLWMLGGEVGLFGNPSTYSNEMWSTADGINWTRVDTDTATPGIQNAPWRGRADFASVVFNGKLWIMGGYSTVNFLPDSYRNDVWSTADGINWTRFDHDTATGGIQDAPWMPRHGLAAGVFNGKVWIAGGNWGDYSIAQAYANSNDVWNSPLTAGSTWTRFDHDTTTAGIQDAPWSKRTRPEIITWNSCNK